MTEPKKGTRPTVYDRRADYEAELSRAATHPVVGLLTGVRKLDERTRGLRACTVITAPPGTGKTSLAIDFARHAAEIEKASVLFTSAEMSTRALMDMLFANVTGMPRQDVEAGAPLSGGEHPKLEQWRAFVASSGKRVCVVGASEPVAMAELLDLAGEFKSKSSSRSLVVIDGLQPFVARERKRDEGERDSIDRVLTTLSQAAEEIGCSMVIISHMTKSSFAKHDRGGFLGSASIEFLADLAIVMMPPKDSLRADKSRYDVTLWITKNRFGPLGLLRLKFDASCCQFDPDAREGA